MSNYKILIFCCKKKFWNLLLTFDIYNDLNLRFSILAELNLMFCDLLLIFKYGIALNDYLTLINIIDN